MSTSKNTINLYEDNISVWSSSTTSGDIDFRGNPLFIGGKNLNNASQSGREFDGCIDDVIFYNRTLSAEDVAALFSGQRPGSPVVGNNMSLDFFSQTPLNNTNHKDPVNLSYELTNVNVSATCTLYDNDVNISTMSGLGNETTNFNLNDSYWVQGYNILNISCTDASTSISEIKYLFVDALTPDINYINYTINAAISVLDKNYFEEGTKFNLSTQTEDANNYALNISIYRSGYGTTKFSNYTFNITTIYNWSHEIDTTGYNEGWYLLNITSFDAHTKQLIDFRKKLKERKIVDKDKIGKKFDEKVKSYSDKKWVKSFKTIEDKDRKKFLLDFEKNVENFKRSF